MAKKKGPGRRGPNLKRQDGYIINQHGVKITEEEARQLRNIVQKVNRKAAAMEKEFEGQPLFYGSRQLDENRQQLKLMGEEMDIMIRRRSAALQEFTSKRQFNAYLKNAQRAADRDYLDYRGKLYKRNLMKAIETQYKEFPELTKGLLMRIRMMPQSEFQKMIGTNRALQIGFVYSLSQRMTQLMAMRESLGIRSPDLDDYDYDF